MNKKADNLDGIGMLFTNFIIVGVAVVIGILIFYSASIDVRQEEAKIISDKIVNAIILNGEIKPEVLENNFDILTSAGINSNMTENGGNYYLKVNISREDKTEKLFEAGTKSFEIQCSLPGKNLAKCYSKDITVLGRNGFYRIKILTGSNQLGSKI